MTSGDRRRAAVLGHPISHSLSPLLHAAAYRHLGLDWSYTAEDVEEASLAAFLEGLGSDWVGLSLTMPLKRAVIPLLDRVDATVDLVGVANTVLLSSDGRVGANTDVPGIVAALDEAGAPPAEEATVLGAGATACSAVAALALRGATSVAVYARQPESAGALIGVGERLGIDVTVAGWHDFPQGLTETLVVSAVPTGVTDAWVHAVPTLPGTLFDVVYDPWPTPLAAQWALRGGQVLSGLDLLVHQAALQVELMTGDRVSVEVLRAALPG